MCMPHARRSQAWTARGEAESAASIGGGGGLRAMSDRTPLWSYAASR